MRYGTLLACALSVGGLGLAACADDLGAGGARSRVYHPVVNEPVATATAPDASPAAPDATNGTNGAETSAVAPWDVAPGTYRGPGVPPAVPPVPPPAPPPAPLPSPSATAAHVEPSLPPGAMAAGSSDSDPYYKPLLGTTPPELPTDGTWINTKTALSLAALRGQAVYLEFSFLKCSACPLTMPYLMHWHDTYGPKGLVVVYVDNGRADLLPDVRDGVAAKGMRHPVFYDSDGKAIAAYGVRAFPTSYLIGRDGKVVWEGNPVGVEDKVEAAIQLALP